MTSSAQLQTLSQQAVAAHQRGDIPEAEKLSQQILAIDAASPVALNVLALIRSQQGRHDEALALLDVILKANPRATAALSNRGLVLQAAGRPVDALATYDAVMRLIPDHPILLCNRANTLVTLGRVEDGLASYNRALGLDANYADGYMNRGYLFLRTGRSLAALADFERVLKLRPNYPLAVMNRAHALFQLRRYPEALAGYDAVLAGNPRDAATWSNRGNALSALDRNTDALASYERALEIQPDFIDARVNLGNTMHKLGRIAEARAAFDAALAVSPREASAHYGHGVLFTDERRHPEAIAAYDTALQIRPDYVEAAYNRGLSLTELRRFADAAASYDIAIKARPTWADAWNNRGIALLGLGKIDHAIADFEKSVKTDPKYAEGWFNLSYAVWERNRDQKAAIAALDRVIAINPDFEFARGDRLHLRMQIADWTGYEQELASIVTALRAGKRVVRPFAFQPLSDSMADLQTSAVQFAERFKGAPAMPARAPSTDKIRIGYVSSDFREQATAYLMAGVYECHDKSAFEIVAFDSGASDQGPTRKRLEAAFDRFVPIAELSDAEAAQRVADCGIDVLVNLNGYFGKPRTGIFAHRPAPVQVNYLGFPGTLGTDFIDYIVADRTVLPEGEERFYTEKVAWLPNSYQANDNKRAVGEAPRRAAVGLPDHGLVFCNFNQTYKLTPQTFGLWMEVLREVKGSVLWLLEIDQGCIANLRREAISRGVEAERLVFAPFVPIAEHLARLQLADLFLDSLPYNAHTTASDALWAGVPLITRRGSTFAGRVAASLLVAAGLPELITERAPEYVALALKLAKDPLALTAVRKKLASNKATCPLFDTQRFTWDLERGYTTMVERARKGEPPATFKIG